MISVIIVSWNARRHLENCLNSLRAHGGPLVQEVIVVDNASTDGSPEMVERLFPEVRLIRAGANLGFARANNLGMRHATGSVLALINSDVVVHAHCFERLAQVMEARPDVGMAGPKVLGSDGRVQFTCAVVPTFWNLFCRAFALDRCLGHWRWFAGLEMRHWDYERAGEVGVLSGCFWLVRRAAVEQVGGLDERFFFYAEDVDWCKRFRDAGWKVLYWPEASVTHFGGGSSGNAPVRYSIEMLRANLRYWEKHHGRVGRCGYFLFALTYHGLRLLTRTLRRGIRWHGSADPKFHEHAACLRWLLTGAEPSARETGPPPHAVTLRPGQPAVK
ncbi:MAG: glycosyltransferase family 2 protein [Verrucomicrobiae bacterium]|nr:glycosyltransferase family 2 protein [Verrucomicrobiae bacterium]MDW8309175.1 glycosyltransferase family 2 protein [Verrucomicrobiales bacterium]